MSALAPNIIKSGLSGGRRLHVAQLLDSAVGVNGFDDNLIYSLRANTVYTLGIAQPSAAPVVSVTGASGSGNVNGSVMYRVKWRDKVTGAMSLSSASAAITVTNQQVTVDISALTAPARVTHWIVERTDDGGGTFYPVNRVVVEAQPNGPNGTLIATKTYVDNATDATIRARLILNNNQGVPEPYRYAFTNENRIFMCDKCPIAITVVVSNGSASVTVSDNNAKASWIGWDFAVVDDVDGKSYPISAVPGSGTLTLESVYTGTGGAKNAVVCGDRSKAIFSEDSDAEAYGAPAVGLLTNEFRLGTAGEPVIGGIGLGKIGVLWCKESHLYYHTYAANPNGVTGDGNIRQTLVRRGIVGPKALFFYKGFIWGMDSIGFWRMETGGEPVDITHGLAYEFKRNALNQCNGYNWHISVDPLYRWLYFNICEDGSTYPNKSYIWDLERDDWVNSKPWWTGMTCATMIKDKNDAERHGMYFEAASVTAGSRMFCDNIGKTLGAKPGTSPLFGTVTAGGASTLTSSGAAWPTGDPDLSGLPVTLIRTADGGEETRTIESNTASQITTATAWTTAPVAGDLYRIAPIECNYLTGWLDCGVPHRKKTFRQLWVKLKQKSACAFVYLRFYLDNSGTSEKDYATLNEDGVLIDPTSGVIRLDATQLKHRYPVPLGNRQGNHIQFEIYSRDAGEPWEFNGDLELEWELDDAEDARRG